VAVPVPGATSAGFSLAPLRSAVNTNTESLQPAIEPTGTQLFGLFPSTCVLCRVTAPSAAPSGETFAIPPPATEAVFSLTVPLFTSSSGTGGVTPGMACRLAFATPAPRAALLPVNVSLVSVAVVWFRSPAADAPAGVVAGPLGVDHQQRAAVRDPGAAGLLAAGGLVVADHAVVDGDEASGAAAVAIAARDAAAAGRAV